MKDHSNFLLLSGRLIAIVLRLVGAWKLVTHGLRWSSWEKDRRFTYLVLMLSFALLLTTTILVQLIMQ